MDLKGNCKLFAISLCTVIVVSIILLQGPVANNTNSSGVTSEMGKFQIHLTSIIAFHQFYLKSISYIDLHSTDNILDI